jgi:NADH-quinone oxidoreductase subunit C
VDEGETLFGRIQAQFPVVPLESGIAHGILWFLVAREDLTPVVRALQQNFGCDLYLDVTAVDWPQRQPRFDVVHHFYSTRDHMRVRIKTRVDDADPTVDSLTAFYGSARYMERECHEMYGIVFRGNDDLRPLLLYEGFVGHPLRKDYPKRQEQPLIPYRKPS